MEDDPADLVKAAAEGTASGLVKPFGDLLTTLLVGAAEEGGEYLRWRVRTFRESRMRRFWQKTSDFIQAEHIDVEPVPLKLLAPIIENASFEDNDFLQDHWAMLLARASRGGRHGQILSSAAEVLKQLNPWEVMLLERCYDALTQDNKAPIPTPERQSMRQVVGDWQNDLFENHDFHSSSLGEYYDYGVMLNNVCRLGMMERTSMPPDETWDMYLTRMGCKIVQMSADFSTFNYKKRATK
jgi:hypothetical protein